MVKEGLVTTLRTEGFKDHPRNHDCRKEMLRLLKIFRELKHEFSNSLQVIYSMVQLKKYGDVVGYINHEKKRYEDLKTITSLSDMYAVFFLLELVLSLREREIETDVSISDDFDYDTYKEYHFKNKVDYYVSIIINSHSPTVCISLNNSFVELSYNSIKEIIAYT